MRLNTERGLLVAVNGSPATAPGGLDVYDVTQDCRRPGAAQRARPVGILGHESGFSPDGLTYWAASYVQGDNATLTGHRPHRPGAAAASSTSTDYVLHGMSVSDDGMRLYGADQSSRPGLQVLDVSDVQLRRPNPQVRPVSFTSWPQVSIPQYAEAVTIAGAPLRRGGGRVLQRQDR